MLFSKINLKLKKLLRRIKRKLKKVFIGETTKSKTTKKAPIKKQVHYIDYSSIKYLNTLKNSSDNCVSTVKETLRLLGYPMSKDTIFPSEELNIDYMYDRYERMIDEYIQKLNLKISPDTAYKKFALFQKKYKSQDCFNFAKTDCVVFYWDWILFALNRGYDHQDYFDFEFYRKDWKERDSFIGQGYRKSIHKYATFKEEDKEIFRNKAKFNEVFKEYIHREWIDISKVNLEKFKEFISNKEIVFIKPIEGTGGSGARMIDITEMSNEDIEKLYNELFEEKVIVEEVIKQHPELAKFNSSTANTLRIYSLLNLNDETIITMACGRFGRAGKDADNFHQGGCGVLVDIESGEVYTDALNRKHSNYIKHPDSGQQFKGFLYPAWNDVINCVKNAAKLTPTVRNVGWDVIINDKNQVEFVEGNCFPNIDLPQAVDQIGKRYIYDNYVTELALKKGVQFPQSETWYR